MPQPWIPRAAILLLAAATLLDTGCSSSTEPKPTGSLQLTVSGLPGAAAAAITVTGPAGYSHSVTVTTTLTALVPGSYTIAALNVFAANATYGPAQASQTISVLASTTAVTASVQYAVLPTGSLQLTVSGLPGAAAAAITVTGPGGYSQSVTVTTTLTALVPGSYTIAALNVFASNATYGPAQASQVLQAATSPCRTRSCPAGGRARPRCPRRAMRWPLGAPTASSMLSEELAGSHP